MGFIRILSGHNVLGIEVDAGWATPGTWTESNYPCGEAGEGCV
jgi:hypothetical protein